MKSRALALLLVPLSLIGIASAQAQTAGRTVYQYLTATDPTVAAPGKWAFGLNAQGWGIYAPSYRSGNQLINGVSTPTTASTKAFVGGGSAFVAYGNFLVQVTGLGGKINSDISAAGAPPQHVDASLTEVEVFGRYILPTSTFWGITPYVVFGYDYTSIKKSRSIGGTFIYVNSGVNTLDNKDTYSTPFVGLGGILPFQKSNAGLRVDLSVGPTFGKTTYTNYLAGLQNNFTGTGYSALGHATVYWHFARDWTAQIGAKGAFIAMPTGSGVESWVGLGAFASIGFDRKF